MTRILILLLLVAALAEPAPAADLQFVSVSRHWHLQVGGYCGDGTYESIVEQDELLAPGAMSVDERLALECGQALGDIEFDSLLTPDGFSITSRTAASGSRHESASAGLHFEVEFEISAPTEYTYECEYAPVSAVGNWWGRLIPVAPSSGEQQPDVLTWGGTGGVGQGTLPPGRYRFVLDSCSWWGCSAPEGQPCEGEGNTFNSMSAQLRFEPAVAAGATSMGRIKGAFAPDTN